MKHLSRVVAIIVFAFGSLSNATERYTNSLQKVFHHRGNISDKIVCYFLKNPVCNVLPVSPRTADPKSGWQVIKFFFPHAEIDGKDCMAMIQQVNDAQTSAYKIKMEAIEKPVPGIALTILYDKDRVRLQHKTFTAIQLQQGVVFEVYHRDFLQELQKKNQSNPVQHYALNVKNDRPHIVLDSGHGAEDKGKVGCFGIQEKDINLAVTMKVASLLRHEGFKVSLTRAADDFVSLDYRTTFANKKAKADLFVSIHSNGAPLSHPNGIETFCPDPALFGKGMKIDNDTLHDHLTSQINTVKCKQSCLLAQHIHTNVIQQAKTYYSEVKDRKVKNSISQVLLGTDMPAALIEIGFLSHEQEARLLNSDAYQEKIAQGICKGIISYITNTHLA